MAIEQNDHVHVEVNRRRLGPTSGSPNVNNRLTSCEVDSGGSSADTGFVYDADGSRVVVVADSGDATHYISRIHTHDVAAGTEENSYTFSGVTVGLNDDGVRHHVFTDHLATVTATLEYGLGVANVERLRYSPYGDKRGSTGSVAGDRTYTGQVDDMTVTGLMFYNARYYDPVARNFVSPDTIIPDPASTLGWNRYAYVNNNPINYSDPSGHCPPNAPCYGETYTAPSEPHLEPAFLGVPDTRAFRDYYFGILDDPETSILLALEIRHLGSSGSMNLDFRDDPPTILADLAYHAQFVDADAIPEGGGLFADNDVATQMGALAAREALVGQIGGPEAAANSLEYKIYLAGDADFMYFGIVDKDIGIPSGAVEIGANAPPWAADTGALVSGWMSDSFADVAPGVLDGYNQRLGDVPGSHRIQYNAIRYTLLTLRGSIQIVQ